MIMLEVVLICFQLYNPLGLILNTKYKYVLYSEQ